MNIYVKPGVILYDYARNRCYLVLERTIDLADTWKCIYRDEDGRFRLYYIYEPELELTRDGVWKVLSGITLTDTYLNSIIRGGEAGFETLKMHFHVSARSIVRSSTR